MAKWLKRLLGTDIKANEEKSDLFPNDRQEFHDDPYPFYEKLRASEPFYRTADGAWVISRYRDNKNALDHPALGNSPSRFSTLSPGKADRYVCANLANNIMPFLDGTPHREQRRAVARIFQKEVKSFTGRLTLLADQAVAGLGEEFNVIEEFAHPFAIKMICEILGIPVETRLRDWSASFFYLFTKIPTATVRDEVDQHLAEFRNWVHECFQTSKPTGVLAGLADLISADKMKEETAIDIVILLFADGLENVDSGIGNALFTFSKHPDQWGKLRGDESLVKSAVDEVLRFESPAQYIARTCLEDFEWEGNQFKKDITVILLLASANRDEQAFPDPARFDITRSPNPHLSFGRGKHSCLGSNLVELELAAILTALRKKFSGFELIGEIKWQNRTGHRWMEEARFRAQLTE